MALKTTLTDVCDAFTKSGRPDTIWAAVPSLIPELQSEFSERLGIMPEVREVSLILATVEPQLAYGTNIIVFDTYFPDYSGLRIRCECCLEHPNAKISVRKSPDDEVGAAANAVGLINANCIGNTFEAHLLRIGDDR